MPIYEFECQRCGKRFEEILGIHEPKPKTHDQILSPPARPKGVRKKCDGELLQVFGVVQARFKGKYGSKRHKTLYKAFQPFVLDMKTGHQTEKCGPMDV